MTLFRLPLAIILWLGTPSLFALHTAYIDFEEPKGWECELAQGIWICQATDPTLKKDSIILSIATVASQWDSTNNYEKYLKKVRTFKDESGHILKSTVKYTRKKMIHNMEWVDSLQLNSELPGFWTRYLSTVSKGLAILVTYIVSDQKYRQLAPQFEHMASTLTLHLEEPKGNGQKGPTSPQATASNDGATVKNLLTEKLNLQPMMLQEVEDNGSDDDALSLEGQETASAHKKNFTILLLLLMVGGTGLLYMIQRRRQSSKNVKGR